MTKLRKKPRKHVDSELLASISAFLDARHMSPTGFGRAVANDAELVRDLKEGRELRRDLRAKVMNFISGAA